MTNTLQRCIGQTIRKTLSKIHGATNDRKKDDCVYYIQAGVGCGWRMRVWKGGIRELKVLLTKMVRTMIQHFEC